MQQHDQSMQNTTEKDQSGYAGEPEKAKILINEGGKENPETDV